MKKILRIAVVLVLICMPVWYSFAVDPINPNTTQEARNLLNYIYSVYGSKILSGQQECEWCSNPAQENNWIYTNTGKYPAILGTDLLYRSTTLTDRAIAYWNAGGIVMIRWHMGAPNNDDTYAGSQGTCSINNTLTPGTSEYNTFISRLDSGAAALQRLEDAKVPVIYAPWHEAGDGCAWFWWAKEGGSQYLRLWQFMYNYMTNTKGLNNLIWLNPQCGTPGSSYYPGKAMCDMVGGDTYGTGIHSDIYTKILGFAGSTIPIALHENGPIPDPGLLQSQGVKFVLFNTWNNNYIFDNGAAYVSYVYNHSYVITRDELPNLKTGSGTTSIPTITAARTATRTATTITSTTTATRTATSNMTATRSSTRSAAATSTATATGQGVFCTPSGSITIPFVKDGAGEFCWETTSLGSFINSWNMEIIEINGINYTNKWVSSSTISMVNNKYIIRYKTSVAWGHFEAK